MKILFILLSLLGSKAIAAPAPGTHTQQVFTSGSGVYYSTTSTGFVPLKITIRVFGGSGGSGGDSGPGSSGQASSFNGSSANGGSGGIQFTDDCLGSVAVLCSGNSGDFTSFTLDGPDSSYVESVGVGGSAGSGSYGLSGSNGLIVVDEYF